MLTTDDHSRDSAGMHYVYHVLSRRAGGVSVGINLNPNNACNWRCVYCQVPGLIRGTAPATDVALLEQELNAFLHRAAHADFFGAEVAPQSRRIVDVAFSGNGEPTSSPQLDEALSMVAQVLDAHGLKDLVQLRLITNGSLVDRARVQIALAHLAKLGGEVWFKVDAAMPATILCTNGVTLKVGTLRRRLTLCADLVPTWVQTCVFTWNGAPPSAADVQAYLSLLEDVGDRLEGVLLYGLARPSLQPEAKHLGRLPEAWLEQFARQLRNRGLKVRVNP